MVRALRRGPALGALLLATASGAAAQSVQPVDFTQVTRPVVEITDRALIDYLLFELIIEPLERPTKLQVIDVTQNGYGPDDVIVVYPTVETFLIPELLPDSVQQVMSQWAPEVEFRLDSGNLPADVLATLVDTDDTTRRAENAIMYDVVQAVERNYRDLPVGILFERDSVGFTFQLWDYNRQAMRYTPRRTMVTDSAVASVMTLLKDVGYVPTGGGSDARVAREAGRLPSVDKVMTGIRSLPDEPTRELAAKTVLLGSYDYDRSGAIDAAREIDALSCDVWGALNGTLPGTLERTGITDTTAAYLGNIVLSISERVRLPAGRRALACLAGVPPPPTSAEEVRSGTTVRPLPSSVDQFLGMNAASEIITAAALEEPGSAGWASAVGAVLLQHFDADESGSLDRAVELHSVPCAVWAAVGATHDDFLPDLGFDGATAYLGTRIGIDAGQRDVVRANARSCGERRMETAAVRLPRRDAAAGGRSSRSVRYSPTIALAGLGGMADLEQRQEAARTVLVTFYDLDGSGHLDRAAELDAISCEVWVTLNAVFPGFAEVFGFVRDSSGRAARFTGNIVFNISERLRDPAARRLAACLQGEVPPDTTEDELEPLVERGVILLPASLREFLATETAARLARLVADYEPGSAVWAAAIKGELVRQYDVDGSGMIDSALETGEIPCVVWNTVRATFGAPLDALGFGGSAQYLGDRIGVARQQRDLAASRIRACAGQ